jgi:GR25 family glycosyltransferase involved in LPS biosynthesis
MRFYLPSYILIYTVNKDIVVTQRSGFLHMTSRLLRISLLLLVSICCLLSGNLCAKLEDHFKKVTHKGAGHQIKNVDFIYLINLDGRREKLDSSLSQLRPYGILPYRFSAVNGRTLSRKAINATGVRLKRGMRTDIPAVRYPLNGSSPVHELTHELGRTYFSQEMSLGVIGCALSHLSILQDALDSGYNTIWVMEDDIAVVQDPHLVSDYIDKLDRQVGRYGWDMLFTDQDTIDNATGDRLLCSSYGPRPNFNPENPARFARKTVISNEFRRVGARFGTYSVIIRRSGMKKVLNFAKKYKIFYPIDWEFFAPNGMRLYTVNKDIVSTQRWAPSDNR